MIAPPRARGGAVPLSSVALSVACPLLRSRTNIAQFFPSAGRERLHAESFLRVDDGQTRLFRSAPLRWVVSPWDLAAL